MLLADFLDPKTIAYENRVLNRVQVYEEIIDRICRQRQHTTYKCGKAMLEAILEREKESSMAYSTGIAIPHIRVDGLEDTLIGMTFLQNPLDYDGTEVNWVVLIFTDRSSSKIYLNIVAALLKLSQDTELMRQVRQAADGHALIHLLRHRDVSIGKDLCLGDIMITDPCCVSPDATLRDLDKIINEHAISLVPVVDENRGYLGEVTVLDVLKVGVPDYLMRMDNLAFLRTFEPLENLFENEDKITVREIMRKDAKTLSPDSSIVEAVFQMIQNRRRSFSVVDRGRLVGVVTAMDVFRRVIKA